MAPKSNTDNARRCAGALLFCIVVLCLTRAANAAAISAQDVYRSAVASQATDGGRALHRLLAAPDGTVWGVFYRCANASEATDGARRWYVRRLAGDGRSLGREVEIYLGPYKLGRELEDVYPIGTTPAGGLVVELTLGVLIPEVRLGRVSPDGSVDLSGPARSMGQHEAQVVDRDGVVHAVPSPIGPADYLQIDAMAPGLPVVRDLEYDKPFGELATAPGYLRWKAWATAFSSQMGGTLLVALVRHWSDSVCHVYRVNARTLALVDSGSFVLRKDMYRSWKGVRLEIPKLAIAPVGKSGYWVFAQTSGGAQPPPVMAAYRLRSDLSLLPPASVETCEIRDFSLAPRDAVLSISHPVWGNAPDPSFDFFGFGTDGYLYASRLERGQTGLENKEGR